MHVFLISVMLFVRVLPGVSCLLVASLLHMFVVVYDGLLVVVVVGGGGGGGGGGVMLVYEVSVSPGFWLS